MDLMLWIIRGGILEWDFGVDSGVRFWGGFKSGILGWIGGSESGVGFRGGFRSGILGIQGWDSGVDSGVGFWRWILEWDSGVDCGIDHRLRTHARGFWQRPLEAADLAKQHMLAPRANRLLSNGFFLMDSF